MAYLPLILGFWMMMIGTLCVILYCTPRRATSQLPDHIAALESDLRELDSQLTEVKGVPAKALTLARVGVVTELEIGQIIAAGNWTLLTENLTEVRDVLARRTTPFGRDLKHAPFQGIPSIELDIREQVYSSVINGIKERGNGNSRARSA